MSGLFGSTTIKGTRLTDFSGALVSVGDPIAFGYGEFVVEGHVIFAPLPPKEHYSKKRQGKGGVKQEVYTYTLSYGVAFAAGPIYGFKWIKRNGKVVYTTDPNAPIEDRQYAAKWAGRVQFYWGTADQMPDSIMESYKGTGNVSAHRFLCFIVLEDEDVTEGGGAPATYEACVIATPPEAYLTSLVYPQMVESDDVVMGFAPTGGELRTILFEALAQGSDSVSGLAPTGGDLYEVPPPEMQPDDNDVGFAPTGGELKQPEPQNFDDDAVPGLAPSGGSLSVPPSGEAQDDDVTTGLAPSGGELWDINVGSAGSDDFSADTMANYTEFADSTASWSISAGMLRTPTGATNWQSVLSPNGRNFRDGAVTAVLNAANDAGLVLRMRDSGNYYLVAIRDASGTATPNTVQLYRRVNGTFTAIGSSVAISFTRGVDQTFEFSASGTALTFKMNGTTIISTTDSNHYHGRVGVRSGRDLTRVESLAWT